MNVSRWRTWTRGWAAPMLFGAFLTVEVGRLGEPNSPWTLALFGALYALAVLGLVRVFPVRRFGLVLAGLVCGPLPISILSSPSAENASERAGLVLLTGLLGMVIGALEWMRNPPSATTRAATRHEGSTGVDRGEVLGRQRD